MLEFLFNLIEQTSHGVQIFLFIVCLVLGMLALIKGADWFVSGASKIAKKLGISSLVVGLTIVAFGTSAPEASVSISSSIAGATDISTGNIVGSNIFNLLVVLGMSALFMPVIINQTVIKRDIPIMLGSGILLMIFSFFFGGENANELIRIEGIILLVFLVLYVVFTIIDEKRKAPKLTPEEMEKEKIEKSKINIWISLFWLVIGLVLVIFGGELVTYGAQNIALELGASEALVGLTIVAVGTSLPELVTSIVAAKKKENEIALGNVIGSNIFNMLFILGAASTIAPLSISTAVLIDTVIMCVLFLAFFILCLFKRKLGKTEGIIFLVLYIIYLVYIILRDMNIL